MVTITVNLAGLFIAGMVLFGVIVFILNDAYDNPAVTILGSIGVMTAVAMAYILIDLFRMLNGG